MRGAAAPRKPGTFGPGNKAAAKPADRRRVAVSLRLPPDAAAILRERSAALGMSQGDLVAAALRGFRRD